MIKSTLRLFLVVAVILVLPLGLAGQSVAASNADANGLGRYIVIFSPGVNGAAKDVLTRQFGGVVDKPIALLRNANVVFLPPQAIKTMLQSGKVLRAEEDAVVYTQAKPTPTPPAEVLPWGVNRIDADLVWDINRDLVLDAGANAGAGVNVAVLDTGIDLDHPDLQANIKGGINTINPLNSADDDNGHGTHVAGIIAGADNKLGVLGVAPQASLYAVKVLSRTGSGYISDIIEGLQWSIDNGIQVVNMSFGTTSNIQSFHDAILAASNKGIVLVAAAGNSGPYDNTVLYPAKYTEVIAVSTTDKYDTIASWSSRGSEVELAAPGVSIYSTYKGGGYATLSGTSMACPHVVGTAALVFASGRATDSDGKYGLANEVRKILQQTADDLGAVRKDKYYGYGLVDAEEAATGNQSTP